MSANRTKHIAALVAWAALHAYYLAFHFSWSNFILLAIALLYLLCTTVLGKKHDETYVVGTLGNLLGTSFAVLLGYYILTAIIPTFKIPENTDFSGAFTAINVQLGQKLGATKFKIAFTGVRDYVILAVAVVFFFGSMSSKHPLVGILFKYLWTCCVFAILIDANYRSKEIMFLYVICTLLFVACDILSYQHDGSRKKTGKRWYNVLNILLLFVLILEPYTLVPFTQSGFIEYYFLTCGFKWYTALYILVVLVVAGLFMVLGFDSSNESLEAKSNTDVFVFWNAICVLITLFFMTRFYVGYWWAIALIYGIGIAIVLTALNPTKVQGNKKLEVMWYLFLPIISMAAIVTAIAGHYGRLLITWAFIGGGTLTVDQFLRRNDKDEWWKDARFYTIVLSSIGAIAAIDLWGFNRLALNFLVLLGMLVVSLVFVWVISSDSGLFAKRSQLMQTITVVLFATLCISLCSKNGGKIKISPDDNGKIVVDLSAARGDRVIENVEFYWLEDYLLLDRNQEGFPEEVQLTNKKIPEQDGRLRVIVTDNYGSQTERIYWVHFCQYSV